MTAFRPPRVAALVARLLAGRDEAGFLLSDLSEEFEQLAAERGRAAAARWYRRQVARSVAPLAWKRVRAGAAVIRRLRPRHAIRALAHAPVTSIAVVLTLALGIGANTAVFSVIEAVLLRPLPYPEPERLGAIWERTPDRPRATVAPANYADYLARSRAFESLAAFAPASMTLTGQNLPDVLVGERVSANYLRMLGATAAIGRLFAEADDQPGADALVVISDALWRERFGADPAVLDRAIVLNGDPYRVIGVLPPGFASVADLSNRRAAPFFVTFRENPADGPRSDHTLFVVGRLRAGVSIEAAAADLRAIAAENARQFPETNAQLGVDLNPLARDLVRGVRASLVIMSGAVAIVVLIACVNVVNLLLIWMSGRRRELAVRSALGATRGDIAADCLLRGLVLAGAGGAAGLVLGVWTRDLVVSRAPANIPRLTELSLDAPVLAMTLAVTLISGLIAGVVPAVPFLRRRGPSLAAARPGAGGDRSAYRLRGVLLAVEVAAAVVLALGAGLLVQSLMRLNGVDLGFRTSGVLTLTMKPSAERYPDAGARLRFFEMLRDRLAAVPGVEAVAFANRFPLQGGWSGDIVVDGPDGPVAGEAQLQVVNDGYFQTFDMPAIRGRLFEASDRDGSAPVVVVSETFARRYAGTADPLGMRVRRSASSPALTIVGVVREMRRDGKLEGPEPQVFFSARQTAFYRADLEAVAVRARVDPESLTTEIRRVINDLEPGQLVTRITTLDAIVERSVAPRRFTSWLLGGFALLSVALAIVGVYGVVAHAVSQRTREIGIRLALGATRAHVIGMIVASGLRWAGVGIAAGLLAAFGFSRYLTSLLFEIAPTDPATFAGVAVLMLAVSAAASYVPARRAARANPLEVVRAD